jgi:uncharacterized membrane protein
MEWLFPWLLFLHVLAAIVAFGPVFTFPVIGALGGREPQHANFATRVSHAITSRFTFPIGITLPITGAAMILVVGINLAERANWWLGLAIVLYVIAYSFAFFVQRPTVERVISLTSAPPPPGASGPPPELPPLVRSIQRNGAFTTILLVVIVFLMVVKPQF